MELTLEHIEQVLDERVRPGLSSHNGGIQITELADGLLKVRMLGQCSGCPSATLTMEELVREELMKAFPDLKDVVLIAGVSDELIKQARELLRRRGKE